MSDKGTEEQYWAQAERWIGEAAFAFFHKRLGLCPMCGILGVDGVFPLHGQAIALCYPCLREASGIKRRDQE